MNGRCVGKRMKKDMRQPNTEYELDVDIAIHDDSRRRDDVSTIRIAADECRTAASLSVGEIETACGVGRFGYGGDGRAATQAYLSAPQAVAVAPTLLRLIPSDNAMKVVFLPSASDGGRRSQDMLQAAQGVGTPSPARRSPRRPSRSRGSARGSATHVAFLRATVPAVANRRPRSG